MDKLNATGDEAQYLGMREIIQTKKKFSGRKYKKVIKGGIKIKTRG